jgi:hypothetical protein
MNVFTARLAAGALLFTTGCAASMGMDRGLDAQPPEAAAVVTDDSTVEMELARRPQLPARPRIAVGFVPPAVPYDESDAWRWQFAERQAVVASGDAAPSVTLFPLTDTPAESAGLAALRVAAAQQGADAVLSVDGRVEERETGNGWAVTYALVLPLLFAPGADLETVFTTRATLRDVRNGYVYLSAEAEAEVTQRRAHLWIDRHAAREQGRREAIACLAQELKRRLTRAFAD